MATLGIVVVVATLGTSPGEVGVATGSQQGEAAGTAGLPLIRASALYATGRVIRRWTARKEGSYISRRMLLQRLMVKEGAQLPH